MMINICLDHMQSYIINRVKDEGIAKILLADKKPCVYCMGETRFAIEIEDISTLPKRNFASIYGIEIQTIPK